MVGFYNVSVIATYICLLSACAGSAFAINDNIPAALICLMISGMLDGMDGAIASLVKRNIDERSFGIQIDSLCDSFCFGVFPAIIAYNLGLNTIWDFVLLFAFILTCIIRLAYFNVIEQKKLLATLEGVDPELKLRAKDLEREHKAYCFGVPVTVISFAFPIFFIVLHILKQYFGCGDFINDTCVIWVIRAMLLVDIPLMLIKVRITKAGARGKIIFGILALATCLALGVL